MLKGYLGRSPGSSAWAALLASALAFYSGDALADECASYGPEAWMSNPYNGSKVAANARFQVDVAPSCGGVEGGPPHAFRLVNAKGTEIETISKVVAMDKNCRPVPCQTIELMPARPLAGGPLVLEMRKPLKPGELGPWEVLARFEAAAWTDEIAPQFDGIADAKVSVIVGSAPISPCQAEPAWELSARFSFDLARDGESNANDLLYMLDGKAEGQSEWSELLSFRPNIEEKTGRGFYELRNQSYWGQSFDFRLRVQDAAGHETVGQKTAALRFPAKPSGEPSLPEGAVSKAPSAASAQEGMRARGGCAGCEAFGSKSGDRSALGLGSMALLVLLGIGRRRAFRFIV